MDVHSQQPRYMEADMDTFFDELSRMGSGESPNNRHRAHPRIRQVHWEIQNGTSEETTSSDSTSPSSEGIGRTEQDILPQGRNGARGTRRVRPGHKTRTKNRPGRGNLSSHQSNPSKRSRQAFPAAMGQVPQRTLEPTPHDSTDSTEQEVSNNDSTLWSYRSREEPPSQNSIPFSLYSTPWPRSMEHILRGGSDNLRGVQPSGLEDPGPQLLPRCLDFELGFQIFQQDCLLDESLHPDQHSS